MIRTPAGDVVLRVVAVERTAREVRGPGLGNGHQLHDPDGVGVGHARWYQLDSSHEMASASLGSTPWRVAVARIIAVVSVRLGTSLAASLALLSATACAVLLGYW